jgi:hypothetical protein
MRYLKVEGHSNLVRDPKTNTIINMDTFEHQEYVSRRSAKNAEDQKIQSLENDVLNIKSDLDEIKNLLRKIANES